jgi:hypothetical protein
MEMCSTNAYFVLLLKKKKSKHGPKTTNAMQL